VILLSRKAPAPNVYSYIDIYANGKLDVLSSSGVASVAAARKSQYVKRPRFAPQWFASSVGVIVLDFARWITALSGLRSETVNE